MYEENKINKKYRQIYLCDEDVEYVEKFGRENNIRISAAMSVIINAKTSNISVCNALDKVVIDVNLPNWEDFANQLVRALQERKVTVLGDATIAKATQISQIDSDEIWYEEFLDYKIVIGSVSSNQEAIAKINKYCGGHSAAIITAPPISA